MKEKKKKEKKKRGFFFRLLKTVLIMILAVLIIAAGLALYLLLSMKFDPSVNLPPEEWKETEPDTSVSKLAFDADGNMTEYYDGSDVMYCLSYLMSDNKIDPADYMTSVEGLSFTGLSADIGEDDLALCGEADYRGIRLVARVCVDLISTDEWKLLGTVRAVRIAGIEIPVGLIDRVLGTSIADETVPVDYEPVFLTRIDSAAAAGGRLAVTGPLRTDLLDHSIMTLGRHRIMRLAQKELTYVGAALETEGDDPAVRFAPVLPMLQEQPDEFFEFMRQLFSVSSATFTSQLGIQYKDHAVCERWFTGFDNVEYMRLREQYRDEYNVVYRYLKSISSLVSSRFSSGKLQLKDDGAYCNGDLYDPEGFFGAGYKVYGEFLDLDSSVMCAVRETAGSSAKPGMLIRGADGSAMVIGFTGGDVWTIRPVPEEDFTSLAGSSGLPEVLLSSLPE